MNIEVIIEIAEYTQKEKAIIEIYIKEMIEQYSLRLYTNENISINNPFAKYDVETDSEEDLEALSFKILSVIHMFDTNSIIYVLIE